MRLLTGGDRGHLGGAPLRGVDLCGIGGFDCRFHGAKAAMPWRRPTDSQRGGTMLAQPTPWVEGPANEPASPVNAA